METVPVIELPHLTEAQKRAYIIADNRLALDAGLKGESRAVTMGGDVTVEVPAGLAADVRAVAMGGAVEVEAGLGRSKHKRSVVRHQTLVEMRPEEGKEGDVATLDLKTMGGTVRLQRRSS